MPDSQNPEHVQKLIREFQLKGQNLIPTVTGEIVPTILIGDLTSEKRGEDRIAYGGLIGATSGAGNQQSHNLHNPVNSGALVILEHLFVYNQTADATTDAFQIVISTGGATPNMQHRDTRVTGQPVGAMVRTTGVAITLGVPWFYVPADGLHLDLEVILSPGKLLRCIQGATNEVFTTSWLWRERDLLTGES